MTTTTKRVPGDPGVWFFITADTCMFGLFFGAFVVERLHHRALFDLAQTTLSPTIGMVNTLLLVSGSWFVVLAVSAARDDLRTRAVTCLRLALACAIGFCVIKASEYGLKFAHGITPATNDFFLYYFILTGLHFVHVMVAVIVTLVLIHKARQDSYDRRFMVFLESGASYWHMVDLLWVVLFPLVYLVR